MSNKIESAPLAYDQSHVEAEIAEINTLIGAGKLEEAASKCRFALETHQDARYFLLQGYVAQQSGDYELAIRASTRANELGHENWLGNFVLGFSLGALGRHDEARVALARAHTLAPGRIDPAVYLLEETAITEGNDAADALFRSMSAYIKDPSFDLAWHLQIIRRLLGQEMLHDAERECRQAIEKYDVAAPHAWLGYIAQQTGRHELAVQSCRRAIELGLQDWTTYFVLAGSLRTLKRHAEARDAAAKAYSLEPQRADSAILYLEETVAADGFADARELFQSMRTGSTDLAVTREWRRLTFENGDDSELEGLIVARQMTARSWAEANGQAVLSVESVEEIPIEAPPVIGAPQIHFKTTVMSNEPYVADLRDVTIFSKSHIVLTPDGVAVNDTGANARFGRYVSHRSDSAVIGQRAERLLIDPSPFELATLDAGVMMSGVVSDAFGHWVPEYLPKLQFLEHHPDFRDLPIVVDEVMPASHFEYLQLIVPNRIIKLPAGRGLRCKRLLYASPATFYPVHLLPNNLPTEEVGPASPRSLRYLKARVESKIGVRKSGGGRYYLSRRQMKWRRLVNDSEISVFLEGHGYETIQIENLSFADQVRLFQNAESIVAANGSSLLNLIFSNPSVHVLVLLQSNLHNWAGFYGQMSALGYKSFFVCGKVLGNSNEKHADYMIPIETLEAALAFGKKPSPTAPVFR